VLCAGSLRFKSDVQIASSLTNQHSIPNIQRANDEEICFFCASPHDSACILTSAAATHVGLYSKIHPENFHVHIPGVPNSPETRYMSGDLNSSIQAPMVSRRMALGWLRIYCSSSSILFFQHTGSKHSQLYRKPKMNSAVSASPNRHGDTPMF
jgi:hypothetical protein